MNSELIEYELDVPEVTNGRNACVNVRNRVPAVQSRKLRFKSSIAKTTKNFHKVQFPVIKDVSIIDRVSRVVFPFTFMIFNLIYWTYYIFF